MKIFFAKYQRKLKSPFLFGNREINHREGFVFRREGGGVTHYSEAAPLLGHSKESLEEVELSLEKAGSQKFLEGKIPLASLQFAADSLQNARILQPVFSNALLSVVDFPMALERYEILAEQGYTSFKIKIFPKNFSLVLEFLKNIEGSQNTFRLDANGSLSESHFKALKELIPNLRKDLIEYIEEPDWKSKAVENFPVPLAIDESLHQENNISALEMATVVIAKPTTIGGRKELGIFLEKFKDRKIVFTSCLETEIGRRSLIKLISEQSDPLPAGISTGGLFQDNFLPDQAIHKNVPRPNAQEALWLASLRWRELP